MGVYNAEERAASNFANDLAGAQPAEELVLNVFSRLQKDCWYVPSEGYEPRGDMFCSHCRTWVEVKYDKLYGRTGNIFIEVDTLKHSEATYFVVAVEEWENAGDVRKPTGRISPFLYVMQFKDLREACRDLYRKGKKPVAGGEFKKMQGYPLPLKTLQKAPWVITVHTKASNATIAELYKRKYNKLHGEQRDDTYRGRYAKPAYRQRPS